MKVAIRQWCGLHRGDVGQWIKTQWLIYDVVAAAVRVTTQRVRKLIAEAKDKFLRTLTTDGPQDAASVLRRAKKAGLGARGRQPIKRALPRLTDPTTGEATETAADRDQVWLQYFGEQEAGRILTAQQFLIEAAASKDQVRDDWEWRHLPSTMEIEQVLRTTARGKSAGLDGLPSDVLCASPSDFAAVVQPLYVKALVRGRQPVQWRGGVLFEAFKGAGAQDDTTN